MVDASLSSRWTAKRWNCQNDGRIRVRGVLTPGRFVRSPGTHVLGEVSLLCVLLAPGTFLIFFAGRSLWLKDVWEVVGGNRAGTVVHSESFQKPLRCRKCEILYTWNELQSPNSHGLATWGGAGLSGSAVLTAVRKLRYLRASLCSRGAELAHL